MLNQADALEKLRNAIRSALKPDKPAITAEEEEKFRHIGYIMLRRKYSISSIIIIKKKVLNLNVTLFFHLNYKLQVTKLIFYYLTF